MDPGPRGVPASAPALIPPSSAPACSPVAMPAPILSKYSKSRRVGMGYVEAEGEETGECWYWSRMEEGMSLAPDLSIPCRIMLRCADSMGQPVAGGQGLAGGRGQDATAAHTLIAKQLRGTRCVAKGAPRLVRAGVRARAEAGAWARDRRRPACG